MTSTRTDTSPAENTSAPALEVRGVRKTFEAEIAPVRALRGVDLTVVRGSFIALMGPSGCGKSTLLNLVAGLEEADEGTTLVTSYCDWSEIDDAYRGRINFPIIPESSLRATLGILARTVQA